jgi:hypothetical protein
LFQRRAAAAGLADTVGGTVAQALPEFVAAATDGIDVQAGDEREEGIAAGADLGRLDGGVPATLLFVEATEQEVHVGVEVLVGMRLRELARGALAPVNLTGRHGGTPCSKGERRSHDSDFLGSC